MTTIKCDNCGINFNKTPSKIKRDKHHFHSRECALEFRRKNEFEYMDHVIDKRQHRMIRQLADMRNKNHLNDFELNARYIVH